jgi:hypothetical protein
MKDRKDWQAWLPPELLSWEWARKVFGVLKRPQDDPKKEYLNLYELKLLDLLEREQEESGNPQVLLENFLPEWWDPGKNASQEELLQAMESAGGWQGPRRVFLQYLKGSVSLNELKEQYGLKNPSLVPVSQLRKDIENLGLREYLELVSSY